MVIILFALSALKFKCWVVTHRAAFMGTAAGLGVIGVPSGMIWVVYRQIWPVQG